mmetsp:Transcript_20262/g.47607  ORF Transcript_20262/g.47607 Transcript_20262/m.47607 type:complete len:328 (+) Transcript_20262:186-1169(+)
MPLHKKKNQSHRLRRGKSALALLPAASLLVLRRDRAAISKLVTSSSDNEVTPDVFRKMTADASGASAEADTGCVVVHCFEDYLTPWLSDVADSWQLDVYESCGQNVSHRSRPFKNAGPEECTAYLDYVIRRYDDMPEWNVFLQSDTFRGLGKTKPICGMDITGHSPFRNMSEMIDHVYDLTVKKGRQFVYFGWGFDRFIYPEWGGPDPFTKNYTNELLVDLGWDFKLGNSMNIRSRPGAVFVMHRDRIRLRGRSVYIKIKEKILAKTPAVARQLCCAMETSWHVVFGGEPLAIPKESTMDHLYSDARCCGIVQHGGNCSDPTYPYAS